MKANKALIKQKQAERIVDVLLDRLNTDGDDVITEPLHEELTQLVERVLTPQFGTPSTDFQSSNIQSFTYDEESRVLEVAFLNGGKYRYYGVEPQDATSLFEAESKGRTLAKGIKPNYPYERVPSLE